MDGRELACVLHVLGYALYLSSLSICGITLDSRCELVSVPFYHKGREFFSIDRAIHLVASY